MTWVPVSIRSPWNDQELCHNTLKNLSVNKGISVLHWRWRVSIHKKKGWSGKTLWITHDKPEKKSFHFSMTRTVQMMVKSIFP